MCVHAGLMCVCVHLPYLIKSVCVCTCVYVCVHVCMRMSVYVHVYNVPGTPVLCDPLSLTSSSSSRNG